MTVLSMNDHDATIRLTKAETLVISQALNEVCNGLHLQGEFEARMGCPVEEARELLELMAALRDRP